MTSPPTARKRAARFRDEGPARMADRFSRPRGRSGSGSAARSSASNPSSSDVPAPAKGLLELGKRIGEAIAKERRARAPPPESPTEATFGALAKAERKRVVV